MSRTLADLGLADAKVRAVLASLAVAKAKEERVRGQRQDDRMTKILALYAPNIAPADVVLHEETETHLIFQHGGLYTMIRRETEAA